MLCENELTMFYVLASVVICFFISLAPFHTQRLLYVLQDYRLINELQIFKKGFMEKFLHSHQVELGV